MTIEHFKKQKYKQGLYKIRDILVKQIAPPSTVLQKKLKNSILLVELIENQDITNLIKNKLV